jgi:hypothetical protein
MKQLLKQAGPDSADVEVVLSNHFVRYLLVEAQPDLSSLDEEQAFVRFSFSEIYGDDVQNWSIRWGEGLDLTPQVASAVDQGLVDQIKKELTNAGLRLQSLKPYLMAAFNHIRKSIDFRTFCFVLVEPGRVCIGSFQDGDWKSLRSSRLGVDWADELPSVIERELQMIGPDVEIENMLLCLPGYFNHNRLAFKGKSIRIITLTPEMLQQHTVLPISHVEVKL